MKYYHINILILLTMKDGLTNIKENRGEKKERQLICGDDIVSVCYVGNL